MARSTHKQKTLSQIAPFWAEAISKKKIEISGNKIIATVGNVSHALNEFSCCIVGESHGWQPDYHCEKCHNLSLALYCTYKNEACPENPRGLTFKQLLIGFLQHWNEKHG